MRKIYLLFYVLLFTQSAWSQKDTVSTLLNEVVISANRTPQEVINTARSVEVIDSKQIEQSAFSTVGELLERKTSLYVVGSGQNPGANQSVFLRGTNSNHTNILINGQRITDPSTPNGALELSELSLANVERIEIIRGSHAAIYGNGSIGGVINIITKDAEDGLSGDVSAQIGHLGDGGFTHAESAFVNYGVNGFYVNGSIFNLITNGIDATRDTITTDVFHTSDQDDFQKTDYSAKVGFKKNGFDVFANYKKTDQTANIDDGAFNDDDNYFVDFDRDLIQYRAAYTAEKWGLSFNGGYTESQRLSLDDSSRVDVDGNFDQQFIRNNTKGYVTTNELQFNYNLTGITALAGIGSYKEEMEFESYTYSGAFAFEQEASYDSLDLSLETKYIFASANFDFEQLTDLKGLSLSLSGRYSEVEKDYGNISFEISPSYSFNNATIYASYAEGFNNPSLTQLYDPNGVFNFTTRGNPNLEEETSTSWELGYKQLISKNVAITTAIYQTRVKNAIEYVYLWDGVTALEDLGFAEYLGDTYINITELNVQGIEFGIEAGLLDNLKFNANFSYLDGKYVYNPDDINTAYTGGNYVQLFSSGLFVNAEKELENLVRRPSYQGFAELIYKPISSLSVSANVRLVDSRPDSFYDPSLGPFGALNAAEVDSYTLLGFTTNYRFTEKLFVSGRIENITDEPYQEINGFNTRGRSFYLKVGYRF